MMNYIDCEEFEFRNWVYVSERRIMGKNFYIDRSGPLGKFFEKLFFDGGWERIKQYVGADDNDVVVVRENSVVVKRGMETVWYFGTTRYGDSYYRFGEKATIRVNDFLNYAEVDGDFRVEIMRMVPRSFSGEIYRVIYNMRLVDYLREFIGGTGARVNVKLDEWWGGCIRGSIEVRGKRKEFTSEVKICPVDEKVVIRGVPFVEGLYALSIPRGGAVDLGALNLKNLPGCVKKRLIFGPGGKHPVPEGAKRVDLVENEKMVVHYDGFDLYYKKSVFGVKVETSVKWFDYGDWWTVITVISEDPFGIEVL